MKMILPVALLFIASGAMAQNCVRDARGHAVCSNGQKAVAANSNTGHVATTNKQGGVTTTQTAHGAQAKTKNGMGVAEGPNGTVCAKGVAHQGCAHK